MLDLGFADRDRSVQFSDHKDTWTERTASAGFHIPLNFSRGYYVTGLSFGATVESISLHGGGLTPLVYGLRFSRARQRAAKQLEPDYSYTQLFEGIDCSEIALVEKAIELQPREIELRSVLASQQLQCNMRDKAVQTIEKARKDFPGDARIDGLLRMLRKLPAFPAQK